ncbi:MAG: hypothetical protein U0228_35810 [Myxococcaceae bacterium]
MCSYDGAQFHGYQAQASLRTVQGVLLEAFSKLALPRNPNVAGRTDRGVSAHGQVLSFKLDGATELDALRDQLNAALPADVRMHQLAWAANDFHAAWSATGREYRYRVDSLATVDSGLLKEAIALATGAHDFRVFHHKTSDQRLRTLHTLEVVDGALRFVGDSFGRHQVRMLTAALLGVARGEISLGTFSDALEKQVEFGCPIADPLPLSLWAVLYPASIDPFARSGVTGAS